MNRRGFFGLLTGAIVAASAGLPTLVTAATKAAGATTAIGPFIPKRKVHARHIWAYDIYTGNFLHRIDVKFSDQQWCVDMMSKEQALDERSLGPALATLNNKLEDFDVEVGDIRSYSLQDWQTDRQAQATWVALT